MERTLVLLKPDAVARGLTGRILQRFEDAGLKIIATSMRHVDVDLAKRHYFDLAERHGDDVYRVTASFMQSGPVIAVVLEGAEAVANVRRLVGPTYPDQAPPGTIRGDFSHMSKAHSTATGKAIANLVHASGNVDEAKYEIDVWFSADELHEYESAAQRWTL